MALHARILLLFVLTILSVLEVACTEDEEPPTVQEQATFCKDVADTRASLQEVQHALVPFDEAALQDARADARADIGYLESSSRELEGGYDLVIDLREDIEKLLTLMASPSLIGVTDDIEAQVALLSADLDSMDAAGNCP